MIERTDLEKCKQVVLSYLDIKPVFVLDEYDMCYKWKHPIKIEDRWFFWENSEMIEQDELGTEKGWACAREYIEDDLREYNSIDDLLNMISTEYLVKFLVDTKGLIDDGIVIDTIGMVLDTEVYGEERFEPYDGLCDIINEIREQYKNKVTSSELDEGLGFYFEDTGAEYVYRVKPKKEKGDTASVFWYEDWIKAAADSKEEYPFEIEKMAINEDAALVYSCITARMIIDLDHVKKTEKESITINKELKKGKV